MVVETLTRPSGATVALGKTGAFQVVWQRDSDGVHRAGLFQRLFRR